MPAVCYYHSTEDIDQLEARLQNVLAGRIRQLKLSLEQCGIVLRGISRTYYAKQLAQHALMAVTSLPISNDIKVQ
jgi:hypothetical protein